VLLQGEYHLSLRVKQAQPCLPAQLFMLFRMNAAAKSVSHSLPDPFPILFFEKKAPSAFRSFICFILTDRNLKVKENGGIWQAAWMNL
jgi:hypothetical protein